MNLSQRKLNKAEWNSVEINVTQDEKNIINLLIKGFHNINDYYYETQSLMNYLKIDYAKNNETHIFEVYFRKIIENIIKKYDISYKIIIDKKQKINTANMVRIESNSSEIERQQKEGKIYEYILLEIIAKIVKHKQNNNHRWCYYYYSLIHILKYEISNLNKIVKDFSNYIKDSYKDDIDKKTIIARSCDYIEKNEYILKHAPIKLYNHQKEIFSLFKNKQLNESLLVLYTAPTATGKTLTPIGLSEKYKIIFVCAARHVGVSLAKSSISVNKKVAFAFGCETADDIRLHYFAAKEFEKNYKSGGIFRVDNSIGDNVEIMICDIKSYLISMYYMTSFFPKENIILFWDEPTITLDYEQHECHNYINEIWKENIIPNIILSSATLPDDEELQDVIEDFNNKFELPNFSRIISNDCKKTIPIVNSSNYVELPHLLYKNYIDLLQSIDYCSKNKTLYRYFDLYELSRFVVILNDKEHVMGTIDEDYSIENYFQEISSITMESIKDYYILVLQKIKDKKDWEDKIYNYFKNSLNVKYITNEKSNGINITTYDANTLTDGPTIYIADNVDKIAKFCIQSSNIPNNVISEISSQILFNNNINKEIIDITKTLEDKMENTGLQEKEKKLSKDIQDPEIKELMKKLNDLNKLYKEITINDLYIPNSIRHIERWYGKNDKNSFTSSIENSDVERIMSLNNVDNIWKLLLLIGIGLFSKEIDISYTEIVKEFADKQKLYLIIANGDYIYGTNYQFCHAYLGKDLQNMTQEKIIQSMGRVGRNKLQHDYSIRFRNDELIKKIFIKEEDKIEVRNMKLLFKSN
tara:strand:- start:512 stop:2944 length:2433 start_codon:yes stop_codon:yes gene_type:complete